MKITLKLEKNTDMGQDSAEDRFYLSFEKETTEHQIKALFNRKNFQIPEIVKKDGTLQVFINKRTPESALVAAAREEGTSLLEDYSIIQALDTLKRNLAHHFELDSNAIETLNNSKKLAEQQLHDLEQVFGESLTVEYLSPFIGANQGLDDEYIHNLHRSFSVCIDQEEKLDSLDSFGRQLLIIKNKALNLKERGYTLAADTADRLYVELKELKKQYDQGTILYPDFKKQSVDAIDVARIELEEHRGWKEILGNVVYCIAGLGIGYLAACLYQGSFFKFKTESAKKLDDLQNSIDEIPGLS